MKYNQTVLAVFIGALLLASCFFVFPSRAPSTIVSGINASDAELRAAAVLADRTIVDFGTPVEGIISYSYLDKPVPELIESNEIPELRTETSYTTYRGVVKDGVDPTIKLQTVIYTQPTFAQDVSGQWRYLEYATTTEQALRERAAPLLQRITEVLVHTAYADTVPLFSEAGDGQINAIASTISTCDGVAFSSARLDTTGSDDDTSTSATVQVSQTFDGGLGTCDVNIQRIWLPFNTGSIPAAGTISAATLNVYVISKSNFDNDGTDYLTVVRTSQATHSSLAAGDYDNIVTTEGVASGDRKDITSISTNAYLSFTLNATGLGWIAKSGDASNCSASPGYTCLGLREGHDNTGTANDQDTFNDVSIRTSEQASDTQDPYLEITYTAPASTIPARGSIKVTSGGNLIITGGGIRIW